MGKIDEKKASPEFLLKTGCISEVLLRSSGDSGNCSTNFPISQEKTADQGGDVQSSARLAVSGFAGNIELSLKGSPVVSPSGDISGGKNDTNILIIEGYEVSSCEQRTYDNFANIDILGCLPAELKQSGRELIVKTLGSLPRYNSAKKRVHEFTDFLYKQDLETLENQMFDLRGRMEKMSRCADFLEFKNFYQSGKVRVQGLYCQEHLACPMCAIRRSGRLLRAYAPKVFEYLRAHPDLKPYLVTFTVPNGEDLKRTFKLLQSSFRSLMRKAYEYQRGQKKTSCEMSRVRGAIASYEVKRGKNSCLWHPHCHILTFADSPFCWNSLRAEWSAAVGCSAVVNVQKVEYDPECTQVDLEDCTDIDLLFKNRKLGGSLLEVLKYPLKFTGVPFEDNLELWRKFKGSRMIQTYGSEFKSVVIPDDDDTEDQQLKDDPFIRFLMFYESEIGSYDFDSVSYSAKLPD